MTPRDRLACAGLVVLVIAAMTAGAAGAAKPSDKKRAAVLQAIVDCRPMTDTTARLACYDAAAAKLDEAEAAGQVVVVDKERAREVRKDIFGLQLPSLDIFNRGGGGKLLSAAEDVDRLTETIRKASQQADGKWVFELQNGAVWRQIDNSEVLPDPRPGLRVEIRKGAIGSFFMKVEGKSAFKVHRDR